MDKLQRVSDFLTRLPQYQLFFLIGTGVLVLAIFVKPVIVKLFPYQMRTARSLRIVLLLAALFLMILGMRGWAQVYDPGGYDPTNI